MGSSNESSSCRTPRSAWVAPALLVSVGAATYLLGPESLRRILFVARWPWWAAGVAIGGLVLAMGWSLHRPLGVSSGYVDACGALGDASCRRSWRLPFLAGIVVGGALAGWAAGAVPHWGAGPLDGVLGEGLSVAKLAWFLGGGVLVGLGARLAGGCTSGHGIVGVARLSGPSLLATMLFMLGGFLVTNLLLGGS